jgi:hypothetical protein
LLAQCVQVREAATVARVLQVSRQALYWTPSPREAWLNECETLDDARRGIGGYVDRYHHRPHSGLNYRTPHEVRRTWEDLPRPQKQAA